MDGWLVDGQMSLLPLDRPTAQENGVVGFDTWNNEIKSPAVISVNVHTLEAAGMDKQLPGRTEKKRKKRAHPP